eukprot:gene3246-10208_t
MRGGGQAQLDVASAAARRLVKGARDAVAVRRRVFTKFKGQRKDEVAAELPLAEMWGARAEVTVSKGARVTGRAGAAGRDGADRGPPEELARGDVESVTKELMTKRMAELTNELMKELMDLMEVLKDELMKQLAKEPRKGLMKGLWKGLMKALMKD